MSIKALIWVCDNCNRASCFQGVFVCEEYRSANTTQRPVKDLAKLGLEHSDYWR